MTYIKGGAGIGPARLTCNGPGCAAEVKYGVNAERLRELSRAAGWLTQSPGPRDLCPQHRPASVARPRP